MVDTNQLYPIAVLIDELKSEDQKKRYCLFPCIHLPCRINSVKSLGTIAVALGPDRTRNELLPYILGMLVVPYLYTDLMDDEEEVLIQLADVLGSFLDYVGGASQAVHVLRPLERLCTVEESTVREKVRSYFVTQIGD